MINFHRLMSFYKDANPDHFCQAASFPSNRNIQTTMSTRKLTCENKQSRQITTTEGPAVTNELSTPLNQCIYMELAKTYFGARQDIQPTFSRVLPESALDSPIPAGPPATALTNTDSDPDPVNLDSQAEVTVITPSPIKDSTPVDPVPLKKPSGNPLQQRSGTEVIILKGGKLSYQPKNQVTRSGRMTQVPVKFKVSYYVGSDIY